MSTGSWWSDDVLDALTDCPPEALYWASAGYRGGFEDGYEAGYEAAETEMADAWAPVAAAVRRRAGQPSYDELVQRRHVAIQDRQPCTQECQRCSTCIAYEAWFRRGRRDFLGLQREAELVQQAIAS